ncbi:MAG: hypothetical protein JW762_05035 [Dehalococcoidales bacterium]|nr:hypothetical protein [Dehalococcoidales bacterium]
MTADVNTVKEMAGKIALIRKEALELKAMSGGNPSVDKNIDRILSSIKMLEINVTDVAEIL